MQCYTIALVFKHFTFNMTKAIQIRIDEKLKKQVDLILDDLGMDTPTAIRLFLKKVVITRSIPFDLKSNITENGFTPEFEEEILEASKEKNKIGPFKTIKEVLAELHKNSK